MEIYSFLNDIYSYNMKNEEINYHGRQNWGWLRKKCRMEKIKIKNKINSHYTNNLNC